MNHALSLPKACVILTFDLLEGRRDRSCCKFLLVLDFVAVIADLRSFFLYLCVRFTWWGKCSSV